MNKINCIEYNAYHLEFNIKQERLTPNYANCECSLMRYTQNNIVHIACIIGISYFVTLMLEN